MSSGNPNLLFFRRSFRYDGGAEKASSSYIGVLSKIFNIRIVAESWDKQGHSLSFLQVPKKGYLRSTKLDNYVSFCSDLIEKSDSLSHSHELIPGSQILRLGDGLHSEWLKIKTSPNLWKKINFFHAKKIQYEKETILHKNLRKIITNSNFISQSVTENYSINESQIELVRNNLSEDFCNSNSKLINNKTILFVGSGWERKGLEIAIKSLIYLPKYWKLEIIGNDKNFKRYVNLARKYKVEARVNFMGCFKVLPQTYHRANILMIPSLYEPFPNVAMEALSQGLAVISSQSSGTSDFNKSQGVWTCELAPEIFASSVIEASYLGSAERKFIADHAKQFDNIYLRNKLRKIYESIT